MIDIKNATKVYKGSSSENNVLAVKDISFSTSSERFIGIIGESGSGKSTLLNLIGGLDSLTSGSILVDGVDISKLSESQLARFRNEKIGFVFQNSYLDPDLTCLENVEVPMIIKGKDVLERKKRAQELLIRLGLEEKINVKSKNLSGGQMQRVSIARALANEPTIILADEPTGNLDSNNGENIVNILKELSDNGVLVIIVTHNMNDVRYCDRVIKLKDGTIISDEVR